MSDHRRPGWNAIIPYLIVDGAADCLAWCRDVVGMEVLEDQREGDKVRHAALGLDGSVLEISDATTEHPPIRACLHIYVPDVDAVYEAAMRAGGHNLLGPTQMPYGERSAGVRDPWNNAWWFACYNGDGAACGG